MTNIDITIWTSFVVASAAILSSAITGLVTYFVTNRSIEAASNENKTIRKHEIEQAWTEREQNRKLDAYQTVALYVGGWLRQIKWALDQASFKTDPPTPQPDTISIDYMSEALVSLVGSDIVWKAIHDFNEKVSRYLLTLRNANNMDKGGYISALRTDLAPKDFKSTLEDEGKAAISSGENLTKLMRSELLGIKL